MPEPDAEAPTNGLSDDTYEVQTNGEPRKTNGTIPQSDYNIPLNKEYAYTPRKLKVITIGAGFSGLIIAHKFQHRYPEMQAYVDHTILEGHSELGGTWLVNTYP